jgi:hypothetical protein
MQEFVRRKNIERYRKLLSETQDEAQSRLLLELLAKEEAMLRPTVFPSPRDATGDR